MASDTPPGNAAFAVGALCGALGGVGREVLATKIQRRFEEVIDEQEAAHCPNCRKPIARRGEHFDGGLLGDYICDKETQMTNPVTTVGVTVDALPDVVADRSSVPEPNMPGSGGTPIRQKSVNGQPREESKFLRSCKRCGASFLHLAPGLTGERGIWQDWSWFCSQECFDKREEQR